MKRYLILSLGLALGFLVLYLVGDAADVFWLADPGVVVNETTWSKAGISVALLTLDVFLPVPSSVLMTLNGWFFGYARGAVVSLVGCLGAGWLGFGLGRCGRGIVRRLISDRERQRVNDLLARGGWLLIVVSRPIPILAETVVILAGTTTLSLARVLVAVGLGSIPPSVVYGLAGSRATSWWASLLVFGGVVALAGLAWAIGRRVFVPGKPAGAPHEVD